MKELKGTILSQNHRRSQGPGPPQLKCHQQQKYIKKTEVESRTQGSRPRTQKKSEAKAKDSLSEDRHSRGQGQRPRTQAQVLPPKKKVFTKISQAISKKKKNLHKNFLGDLHKKTFSKKFFKRSTKF